MAQEPDVPHWNFRTSHLKNIIQKSESTEGWARGQEGAAGGSPAGGDIPRRKGLSRPTAFSLHADPSPDPISCQARPQSSLVTGGSRVSVWADEEADSGKSVGEARRTRCTRGN